MSPAAVFVGPMASGKTKIGKRIARMLELDFVDTDKRIVAEHGPVSEIFERDGEPRFRELERAAVVEALATDGIVALGGGAVLDPATRADLARERVVFLTVAPDVVEGRLALQHGKRPLVAGGLADWERIYAERLPLYDEVATVTFDTSVGDFDSLARKVAAWLTT